MILQLLYKLKIISYYEFVYSTFRILFPSIRFNKTPLFLSHTLEKANVLGETQRIAL